MTQEKKENDIDNIDVEIERLTKLRDQKKLEQKTQTPPVNINEQLTQNLNPRDMYGPGQPPSMAPNDPIPRIEAAKIILTKLQQTNMVLIFLAVAPIMTFLIGMFFDIIGLGIAIFFIPVAMFFRMKVNREITYLSQKYNIYIQKDRFRQQIQQGPYNPNQPPQQPYQGSNQGRGL